MPVVAGGAGFAGDRVEPAVALATSGLVDCVALECLAERTIVAGLRARRADPDAGYDPRLRRRMAPLLPAVAAGCKVVTNLGSANPAAAARAIAGLAGALGLRDVSVAAVLGDDVSAAADAVAFGEYERDGEWLGMHAYIGSEPIARALADGADIVVTGRAADAALFAGPVLDALDGSDEALAGALCVGHLLECSGQVTGGNAELVGGEPPLSAIDSAQLGYPLADVASDGTAVVSKLPGTGGRVDRLTCTLQLLYEVHDPSRYITPDGVVDFTGVAFDQVGTDRVRVSGARMSAPPPETLKVSGFRAAPGAMADVEIGFAGSGALRRARTAAETLALRLERLGFERFAVDVVGADSLLGPMSAPVLADPPEARAHVTAVCDDDEHAQVVEDEVYALTLSGPAAGAGLRSERRPRIDVVDGLIPRERVPTELVWERAA